KRLAGAHFIFNVVTAVVAISFMSPIMDAVSSISGFLGIADDNHTLKLAVFDTLFKVIGVIMFIPFISKLVSFLETVLKGSDDKVKIDEIDGARYLNESSLELPATAMASILRETKHLYDNAFEIIAHGLNVKRTNIISDMPIQEVVKDLYSKNPIDIDAFYRNKIKGIYGYIIDFATKAQSDMSPEDIEILYRLKVANRDIVEAVKDIQLLQKNLIKYANSTNEHIKVQYNTMRVDLSTLLRNINIIVKSDEDDVIILLLAKAKIHAQRFDIIANGTLDSLIRKSLITNEMATSLMNDSSYAYDISKKMIDMAEIIFTDKDEDIKSLTQEMSISDDDIQSIINQKD
ncbi:MAG: Na/Pi cotransporter family protein, partial [Sulfurimonas sp.]|nr:Na/Pi cotransporter family protein [Sulfurimonas sp.]